MGGRFIRLLVISALFLTFAANLIFVMQTRECAKDTQIFPWMKSNLEIEVSKQERYINVASRQENNTDVDSLVLENSLHRVVPNKENPVLNIEVYSSRLNVSVTVNNKTIFSANHVNYIGLNVVVLNQKTGAKMASRNFNTFVSKQDSEDLVKFVEDITVGRILCFIVKDEASYNLQNDTRKYFTKLGSRFINRLRWRDMWAMVIQKKLSGARVLAESFQISDKKPFTWASPIDLVTTFISEEDSVHCDWGNSETSRRRRKFCSLYEGYHGVCLCDNPQDINMDPPAFPDGSRLHLPVAVMVGNRPHYFFRMLKSLRKVIGLDASMVTVYIDGLVYHQSVAVAELFGLKVVQHEPVSRLNGRIAQHYKRSLSTSFDNNPEAQYLIILEEDLEISVDILSFFQQLLPVLEKDESLFCISAWNDQGYDHAANDPSMLYRIETMPGLGWVLSRKIYKGELEKKWPGPQHLFDWDMWTRMDQQIKGRECIIPDISRTYHFGAKGLNVGPGFQIDYFQKHAFNKKANVKLNADLMFKESYEKEIHRLISAATLLDHKKTPCSDLKNFVPNTKGKTYLFYITMKHKRDYQTWTNVARCFRIWDLDARGFHNSMFRLWYKKNHIIVVGCPASKYCSFKPDNIAPIDMPKTEKRPKEEDV
ncbi:protein O-linked-mannose beta-1,2-N-acetylglucosaminyltransferase 1-like isoform X2 [Actinia tenebrosa]|uniref:Alpha-1,3-mannosyl-glycoprotein 2-beta-N-acetylglucosaminyltransferase n=1 Tax=Actinia tenebrosa TaxID=6105 RepID=A0A6P8HZ32_ACTTE|nr:protein O-linked-mannose beta-1,2-N-acetylglucosaminyltransferase 1-like isoform X2 [Actinia tenebrosa]